MTVRVDLLSVIEVTTLVTLLLLIASCGQKVQETKEAERVWLLSFSQTGEPANGPSSNPAISADGRFVAFASLASNLVANDTNEMWDIFLTDRQNNATALVSLSSDGVQGNGPSRDPSISSDGRLVAFVSEASNLVSDDANGLPDIFVYDRDTKTTSHVSVSHQGWQADGASQTPALSADGRVVAFASRTDVLSEVRTKGHWNIYLHDRIHRTTGHLSISRRQDAGYGSSLNPAISTDGRIVTFQSMAGYLVPETHGPLGMEQIYTYDHRTGVMSEVTGRFRSQWVGHSRSPVLNADGRFVAFESGSRFVSEDTNRIWDLYLYDRVTGDLKLISLDSEGKSANGRSGEASLSADGRLIAFTSEASNLVPNDNNGISDIFVYDQQLKTVHRINLGPRGVEANGASSNPDVSADGRFIAFTSAATNLVRDDTDAKQDIFVTQLLE